MGSVATICLAAAHVTVDTGVELVQHVRVMRARSVVCVTAAWRLRRVVALTALVVSLVVTCCCTLPVALVVVVLTRVTHAGLATVLLA